MCGAAQSTLVKAGDIPDSAGIGTRLGGDSMPIGARRGACAGLLIVLAAAPAAAQGGSDLFGDRWQVGGVIYVSPSFEGSKSYEAIAFPFIAPAGVGTDGVVQIKGADDVRLRVFQAGGFELGPLAGYRFGRDADDVAVAVEAMSTAAWWWAPSAPTAPGRWRSPSPTTPK